MRFQQNENGKGLMFQRQNIRKAFLILFFLTCSSSIHLVAQSNDSILISGLLKDITAAQVSASGEFYPGSFPSYRESAGFPHNRQSDNNIFFTAISIFTLRNLLPQLGEEDKKTAMRIIENAQPAFPYYQNKEGLPFYNFWPTGKGILPHTLFVRHFNNVLGMGEDADDAVMALMATGAADSICRLLKQRMLEVSNLSKKRINSTFPRYRNLPAYSTYLGLHMPPDFDLCVHCNILYFLFSRKLPMVKQDTATIRLLSQILKEREYMSSPVYLSPYYDRRPVLMYHLARLMGSFRIPELELYKAQLVGDIQEELKISTSLMDRIILSTSLIRLGELPAAIPISSIQLFEKSGTAHFIFFQARAAFWYPHLLKKIFLHSSYLHYNFYCPVYTKVLLLEYLLLRKNLPLRH